MEEIRHAHDREAIIAEQPSQQRVENGGHF
jgi:hypothetical protein